MSLFQIAVSKLLSLKSSTKVSNLSLAGDVLGEGLKEAEGLLLLEALLLAELLGLKEAEGLRDADGLKEAEGLKDAEGLKLAEALLEALLLAEALGEIDAEGLRDADGLRDAEGLNDAEGLTEADGERSVKISQDIAPFSVSVTPVRVTVGEPAVVLVAVVKRNTPASASMSSSALAQVLALVSF